MHFANLDLIPSQQFRGVSLPVTLHSSLFIAETGVSPKDSMHQEKSFLPISEEAY